MTYKEPKAREPSKLMGKPFGSTERKEQKAQIAEAHRQAKAIASLLGAPA